MKIQTIWKRPSCGPQRQQRLSTWRLMQRKKGSIFTVSPVSGPYERQAVIYDEKVAKSGEKEADKYSARPGYSEHQTGLAIDVSTGCIGYRLLETFANTNEGKWLAENAHNYGFVIRYPEDKTEITGYAYEPWHLRYVGIELAGYLAKTISHWKNITVRRYLPVHKRLHPAMFSLTALPRKVYNRINNLMQRPLFNGLC